MQLHWRAQTSVKGSSVPPSLLPFSSPSWWCLDGRKKEGGRGPRLACIVGPDSLGKPGGKKGREGNVERVSRLVSVADLLG